MPGVEGGNGLVAPIYKKTCARCGRPIRIREPFLYVYKRKDKNQTLYFCGWTCLNGWDKDGKTWRRAIAKD